MKSIIFIGFLFIVSLRNNLEAGIIERGGLKIGACIAGQKWQYTRFPDPNIPSDFRRGLDFALYVQTPNCRFLSLIAELHYIQKGRRLTVIGTGIDPDNPHGYVDTGPVTLTSELNYLSLPILMKTTWKTAVFSPYVLVGPRIECMVFHSDSPVLEKFNKIDYGLTLGVGLEINVPFLKKVLLEGRYSPNLGNSYENENVKVRNDSFEILAGKAF